jgi:8-oxo-dGTP pyrophosphatase MutT (NUDIX family)
MAAAQREVLEEVGLAISPGVLIFVGSSEFVFDNALVSETNYVYAVISPGASEQTLKLQHSEIAAAMWIPFARLEDFKSRVVPYGVTASIVAHVRGYA